MILVVHPHLAERAVYQAARADEDLAPHYQRQFADCYAHPPGARRDEAFAALHQRWFVELGLRDAIAGLTGEFPNLRQAVGRLLAASAPGPRMQTAELYGAPGRYAVVLAVCPATLLDRETFAYWARHELLHIDDMLDPAFEYDRTHQPTGRAPAESTLGRERYALLWAISVDARLASRGQAPADIRVRRGLEFERAFGPDGSSPSELRYGSLWDRWTSGRPTHPELLGRSAQASGDPGAKLGPGGEAAGAACPLCAFPTFDWAQRAALDKIARRVGADFPTWRPEYGACGRCAEVYGAGRAATTALGATAAE